MGHLGVGAITSADDDHAAAPAYYGPRAGWDGSHYGGGLVGLILLVVLILWLTGNVNGGPLLR